MPDAARGTAFRPAHDPLGRTAVLDYSVTIPVLGVPLEIRSNAAAVIAIAEIAFGRWRGLDAALRATDLQAHLDVIVQPGDDAPLPSALVLRRHGAVFVAAGGANLFVTDLERAHATAFLTPSALDDPAWIDWHALAWGRFAASLIDRVPFHAAAVLKDGVAVLLIGQSGVGKSTLTYACARAGWQVLAEEVVHVSVRYGLRLWGDPAAIGLSEDAVRWFPEVARHGVTRRPDGKMWRRVPVPADALGPLTHAGAIALCCIERGDADGVVGLTAPAEARELFEVAGGFDQMPDQFPAAATALLARPLVRIQLGRDPRLAVGLVDQAAHVAGRG